MIVCDYETATIRTGDNGKSNALMSIHVDSILSYLSYHPQGTVRTGMLIKLIAKGGKKQTVRIDKKEALELARAILREFQDDTIVDSDEYDTYSRACEEINDLE